MERFEKNRTLIAGTRAERIALVAPGMGQEFHETDYPAIWQWRGAWRLVEMLGPPTFVPYADATYEYWLETPPGPGVSKAAAIWRATRRTIATGDTVLAGTGNFEFSAVDLATVAGHPYALGA